MLFMGIGIFILGASFWYQKLTKTTEQSKSLESDNLIAEEIEAVE